MQLTDRIEKRRFVGREFLLWLWFESELFDGTLTTKEHGSFGFWIERQIILTRAKEATRIAGVQPAAAREAKESLLLGKMPEAAAFHISMGNHETTFTLKAERLLVTGLKLPTVLGTTPDAPPVDLSKARRPPPRRKREEVARQEQRESDEAHESFYERMQLTRDFEAVLEALYRDFLTLRLGEAWEGVAVQLRAWAAGEDVDAEAYRAERDRSMGGARRAPARARAAAR